MCKTKKSDKNTTQIQGSYTVDTSILTRRPGLVINDNDDTHSAGLKYELSALKQHEPSGTKYKEELKKKKKKKRGKSFDLVTHIHRHKWFESLHLFRQVSASADTGLYHFKLLDFFYFIISFSTFKILFFNQTWIKNILKVLIQILVSKSRETDLDMYQRLCGLSDCGQMWFHLTFVSGLYHFKF